MVTIEEYLKNPCGTSSIPYWKAKQISIPDDVTILHEKDFDAAQYTEFIDEPYFRLSHDLNNLSMPQPPQGYALSATTVRDFAEHISRCYAHIEISEAELRSYTTRPVYVPGLWLAVRDKKTGEIAATGIAELDRACKEGILEWIQVSENARGCGLGSYVVTELLWRMRDLAQFVTVSGQCSDPTNPERLYRRCGFTGNDVWHILRRRRI